MKRVNKFGIILFLAASTIISSCSKDDNGGGSSVPATGTYINAKVNGTSFSTVINGVSAATATRSGSGTDTIIMVLGSNLNGTTSTNTLSINLFGITTPGTYAINSDSESVMGYVEGTSEVAYGTGICAGSTGTVTVTTIDATKIEGTFSFTGKDGENCAAASKSITNGQFRGVFSN